MYIPSQYFEKNPSSVLPIALVIFLFGLFMFINSWNEFKALPAQPKSLDIKSISPVDFNSQNPLWVSLYGIKWDCDSIKYVSSGKSYNTEVIATDPNETVIVLVEFSSKETCDAISKHNPTGYLRFMSSRRYERFVEFNEFDAKKYKNPSAYYDLCAWCGKQNASIGIGIGVTVCIMGLSLYPLVLLAHYKRYRRYPRFKKLPPLRRA